MRFFWMVLLLVSAPLSQAQVFSSGESALQSMRRAGKHRPQTLTFEQKTLLHRPNGNLDTLTWYEAGMPGKLRIDVAPIENGNGMLYLRGKRLTIRNFKLVQTAPDQNILVTLLMDVYHDPLPQTVALLDSLHFNLKTQYETQFMGHPVTVIGTNRADDLASPQFWVDQRRKVVLRVIQPLDPGGKMILDAQITDFRRIKRVWHESAIKIFVNGKLVQEEVYSNIRAGTRLDPAIFDPASWRLNKPYWQ